MKTTEKIYLVTGGVMVEPEEEILLYPIVAFDDCDKANQYCVDQGYQPKGDLFIKHEIYRKVVAVTYYPNND